MDDITAIQYLRRGDVQGLDVLVTRYQTKAVRAAYLVTQDRAIAEDVMQNAFIRTYERIHLFDILRPFEPWLMRMVVNLALNAVNRQKRTVQIDLASEEMLAATLLSPSEAIEQAELEAVVREALAQLSPEQRAVVVLRYYLAYTETEMAQELHAPVGTIRWRLHAARKTLRGLLSSLRQPRSVRALQDE